RARQEFDERLQCFLLETQAAEIKAAVAGIKYADDNLLSPDSREDRDAQFDSAQFGVGRRVALLWQVGLIGYQIGHHFEPAGYFFHEIERQVNQFIEHSIEADADHQGALPRFDVDVAGAHFDGVNQQVINQCPDFNG